MAEKRLATALALFSGLVLFIAAPIIVAALWSVAGRWAPPHLLPEDYTLAHWSEVLGQAGIGQALVLSLFIAVCVTLLTAVLALPTAWAMARHAIPGKRFLELFILAPSILPGIVVAVSIGEVFLMIGIAYSVAGVILVQVVGTLPLTIRLMTSSFEMLPEDLLLAARALGAGWLARWWYIVLPLSRPALLAGGLLSFVSSFEEFDKSFIVGAPVVQTLPVKLYTYLDPDVLQFPLAAVAALILLLPVLVLFLAASRVLRDDIMAGGIGRI